jgi:8-oxo-dGTP pyrophosphatase MutT (NUDIX family)
MKQNVGTALFYNDSVLLAKRITHYKGNLIDFPGYWAIFCGAVELGESPLEAAYRELKEETGLLAKEGIKFFTSFNYKDYKFLFHTLELRSLFFPDLCVEHTEFGWYDIKLLKSFPYNIDKNIVNCILEYHKTRIK